MVLRWWETQKACFCVELAAIMDQLPEQNKEGCILKETHISGSHWSDGTFWEAVFAAAVRASCFLASAWVWKMCLLKPRKCSRGAEPSAHALSYSSTTVHSTWLFLTLGVSV